MDLEYQIDQIIRENDGIDLDHVSSNSEIRLVINNGLSSAKYCRIYSPSSIKFTIKSLLKKDQVWDEHFMKINELALNDNFEQFKELISTLPNINCKNSRGETLLWIILEHEYLKNEYYQFLLNHPDIDLNIKDNGGKTVLDHLVLTNNFSSLDMILSCEKLNPKVSSLKSKKFIDWFNIITSSESYNINGNNKIVDVKKIYEKLFLHQNFSFNIKYWLSICDLGDYFKKKSKSFLKDCHDKILRKVGEVFLYFCAYQDGYLNPKDFQLERFFKICSKLNDDLTHIVFLRMYNLIEDYIPSRYIKYL